jgi:MoaA/NifB/PqqE/SkfB family radical SAM enzyme
MSPLDHPHAGRPHRVYVALTNHCNRACPWCSTWSSPAGSTWITWAQLAAQLPADVPYEVQLEGGEPTVHRSFWGFVARLRDEPRCAKLILCTNGVVLPRKRSRLQVWLERLGAPLLVKLSINHYLMEHDPGLLELALAVGDTLERLGGDREVVYNVRLRRGYADDDRAVAEAVERAGLGDRANVFFLQRYGMASDETAWDAPFLAGHDFRLVNPDGREFGTDLLARSAAMGRLP